MSNFLANLLVKSALLLGSTLPAGGFVNEALGGVISVSPFPVGVWVTEPGSGVTVFTGRVATPAGWVVTSSIAVVLPLLFVGVVSVVTVVAGVAVLLLLMKVLTILALRHAIAFTDTVPSLLLLI